MGKVIVRKWSVFLFLLLFIAVFTQTVEASYKNSVDISAPYEDSGFVVIVNDDLYLDRYVYDADLNDYVEREPTYQNTGAIPDWRDNQSLQSFSLSADMTHDETNSNLMGYDDNGIGIIDPNTVIATADLVEPVADSTPLFFESYMGNRSVAYYAGQEKELYVNIPPISDSYQMTAVDFVCHAVSEYATVWTPVNINYNPISKEQAESIALEFDAKYEIIKSSYGNSNGSASLASFTDYDESDPDGDGKVAIVCYDVENDSDTNPSGAYMGGYFYSIDLYDKFQFVNNPKIYYSNGMDMIHIDSAQGMVSGVEQCYPTLFHELQHLIAYVNLEQYGIFIPTFLNEAFSESTTHLLYGEMANFKRIEHFNDKVNTAGASLTFWESGKVDNYSMVYLFSQYLRTHYPGGNEFYLDFYSYLQDYYLEETIRIRTETGDNTQFITLSSENTVAFLGDFVGNSVGEVVRTEDIVRDFYIALAAKEATGPYGFNGEEFAYHIEPYVQTYYAASGFNLKCGAAMYVNLNDGTSYTPSSSRGANIDAYLSSYNPAGVTLNGNFLTDDAVDSQTTVTLQYFDSDLDDYRVEREFTYTTSQDDINLVNVPKNDNYRIVLSKDQHVDVILDIDLLGYSQSSKNLMMGESETIALPYGDVTGDGNVNFSDLAEIRNSGNYNKTVELSDIGEIGDLNNDGIINFSELSLIRNSKNYNKHSSTNIYYQN